MATLRVQQADLDAVEQLLREAGEPVLGVCPDASAVGSSEVAAALAEVDSIVSHVLRVLADSAASTADDVVTIGVVLQSTDDELADGAR